MELECERRARLQSALDSAEKRAYAAGKAAERAEEEANKAKEEAEKAKVGNGEHSPSRNQLVF